MKVRELIEALQKVDPDKDVMAYRDDAQMLDDIRYVVGIMDVTDLTDSTACGQSGCFIKHE